MGGEGDDILNLHGVLEPSPEEMYFEYRIIDMDGFSSIEFINGTRYNDSLSIRADQLGDLRQISGGLGNDSVVFYGEEVDLQHIAFADVETLSFGDDNSAIIVDKVEDAKHVIGYLTQGETLILTAGTLTEAERLAIHRRGVDTIITYKEDGSTETTTHHAPEITALDGDRHKINVSQTIHIDAGRNAVISSDDGLLGKLQVRVTDIEAGDRIELDTSGRVSLSNGHVTGSIVSVDGIEIGSLSIKSNFFDIAFNDNAIPTLVQEILYALTYTHADSPLSTLREINILLKDVGGRVSATNTVIVEPWEWSAERITEGQGAGTEVGTLAAADADGNDLTYVLDSTSAEVFELETTEGGYKVKVKESVTLDYETLDHRSFIVQIIKGSDTIKRTFSLLLQDVDEVPGATFDALSVDEGAEGGTPVGTITAFDPELGDVHCTLTSESEDIFELTDEGLGAYTVKVKNGIVLDYEDPAHRSFTVTVSDGLNEVPKTFTLNLQNVNEAPSLTFTSVKISEGVGSGTVVGTLVVQDIDGPSLEYSITGASAALFELEETSAGHFDVKVKAGVTLDFETFAHREFTVSIFDGSNTVREAYTLDLTNIDEAPTLTFTALTVNEGAGSGTVVGKLSAKDPEGKTLSYTLTGGSENLYSLVADSNSGYKVAVKNGVVLDYEDSAHRTLSISVSDGIHTVRKTYDLNLTDIVDVWTGTRGKDTLRGQSGADIIKGLAGDDKLHGNAGNDTLYGGTGNDSLKGDQGQDTFVFNSKPNKRTNKDKITDFSVTDDTIWLDNKVFTKLGAAGSETNPVQLKNSYLVVGSKAKDRDDHIIYDKTKGVLLYDADGSGSRYNAVEIATLSKNLRITDKDFFVI